MVIVLQTLLHMRRLLFAQTYLAHTATRITDGKNGNRMSPTTFASLAAASTVTDIALEQGAAQNVASLWNLSQKAVALANDLFLRH